MHWYKRDPDAALAGMAELTFEERGAYNGILDLLYSRDGDVPDDDATIARILGTQPRTWARLKKLLIDRGKIWIDAGKITAKRVKDVISEANNLSIKQRTKANKRWNRDEKDNENNAPDDAAGNASTSTTTATPRTTKIEGATAPPARRRKRETKPETELSEGFAPNWEAATRVGLSRREAEREFLKFKNHAAMKGRTCVNWQSAWSNWCITSAQYLKKPQPGDGPRSMFSITPASRSWNAWKAYFRDNNDNVRAAMMDKCADEGRAFTVSSEWPTGHEMNNAA